MAPATLPATSGWAGSDPKPPANVHTDMSRMGFQGKTRAASLRVARGSSWSGRWRMLSRTFAALTKGSTSAKNMR